MLNKNELQYSSNAYINVLPTILQRLGLWETPTTFENSTSWYQALKYVLEYMIKELIPHMQQNDENIKELNDLYNEVVDYVNNYFTDLNIQNEINNKLDQMAQDGTLANIINEEIFNELNQKIENLENTQIKENIFLGAFFNGTTEKLNFCTSLDGVNFADILQNVDISGRDPNILFNPKNKTFYLSVTGSGDTWDFTCYTSKDLIQWTKRYVNLGVLTPLVRWAPELFLDKNGDMYATISAGTDTSSNMAIYIAKCNDIENLTFDTRTQLSLSQTNIIDSNIIYDKENDLYYLTCKNNTTSKQLIYSSQDLINWNLINSDILKTNEPCEGGFLLKINNKFNFYGDTWQSFGYYYMAQTEDLSNFENFKRPNSLINKRHGSICLITDPTIISLITNLETYKQNENVNLEHTQEYALSGTIENLIVYPHFIYRITANTVIKNLTNPFNLSLMPFYFSMNKGGTITINNVINSERQTKAINKTIKNSAYSNEKINFLTLIGNPTIEKNSDLITYTTDRNITISPGWEVQIYSFKRFKDYIHIDGDFKKTSTATSNIAFTITNNELKPSFNYFTTSNKGKTGWLKPDGSFNEFSAQVDETNFFSFEYLCI